MARAGYANATIVETARVAGLAPGLVHYHFRDKREILTALVSTLVDRVEHRVNARLPPQGTDPRKRLHAALDGYVGLGPDADPTAVAAWVVVGTEALRDDAVRALYTAAVRRSLGRLEDLVRPCLPRSASRERERAVASALLAAIEGAFRLSAAAPGVLPVGFAAPMLRRMANGLLAGGNG
jgi:TetR/AcrR family transcriptional repressor of bet genes